MLIAGQEWLREGALIVIKRLARYILRGELSDSKHSVSSLNARIGDLKEALEPLIDKSDPTIIVR